MTRATRDMARAAIQMFRLWRARVRLDRTLTSAGLPLDEHRTATRCRAIGETIAARRAAVRDGLRAKFGGLVA